MPSKKYTGSPGGSGNPPGEHSPRYLNNPGKGEGHFITRSSYRGDMHVGIHERAKEVGNQPQSNDSDSVNDYANKKDPY